MATTWKADELLRGESSKPYSLIIVNQPIRQDLLARAWRAASKRLCADGGANRLFDTDVDKRVTLIPYGAMYEDTTNRRA
ncbi:uncharacterized protein I303_107342 [Kwoniella dejecticola CBS 10117]|uniref:Uncharacterized protein n=1 Tax=Kwoniella dejecticola CBS 10117 TaxID=1296121 RepID=A0AAJ8MJS1_9TREE